MDWYFPSFDSLTEIKREEEAEHTQNNSEKDVEEKNEIEKKQKKKSAHIDMA